MTSPRRIRLLAFVAALVVGGAVACSERRDGDEAAEMHAFIAQGEAAHFEAEHRLAQGDAAGARAALESALRAPSPRGADPGDVRVVRQDLLYQLAVLALDEGHPEDAARLATEGLALGAATDVFTSNLQIARGRALERTGDPKGAARDYHAALVTSEALLERSLGRDKSP